MLCFFFFCENSDSVTCVPPFSLHERTINDERNFLMSINVMLFFHIKLTVSVANIHLWTLKNYVRVGT